MEVVAVSDCTHKVTVQTWRNEQNMVTRTCENCGDTVLVSLPSPPPGEGHKTYDEHGRERRRRGAR